MQKAVLLCQETVIVITEIHELELLVSAKMKGSFSQCEQDDSDQSSRSIKSHPSIGLMMIETLSKDHKSIHTSIAYLLNLVRGIARSYLDSC